MKKNESSRPVQVSLFGSQAVMLHPDNPPHLVQKFLGHGGNLYGISNIWPEIIQIRDRKNRRLLVGKSDNLCRKMPQINGKKSDWPTEIKNLGEKEMEPCGIKVQIARLFDKNSFRHIFSS